MNEPDFYMKMTEKEAVLPAAEKRGQSGRGRVEKYLRRGALASFSECLHRSMQE